MSLLVEVVFARAITCSNTGVFPSLITGTVIGCYLVNRGMSGEEALVQIARWRQGTPDGGKLSPETEAQRILVRQWMPA